MSKSCFFSVMFQVSLPKIDTSGEYAPLMFSLEHYTCNDNNAGRTTGEGFCPLGCQLYLLSVCCTVSLFLQSVTLMSITQLQSFV